MVPLPFDLSAPCLVPPANPASRDRFPSAGPRNPFLIARASAIASSISANASASCRRANGRKGYRYYDEAAFARHGKIAALKSLGMSREEIARVIDLYFEDGKGLRGRWRSLGFSRPISPRRSES